MIRLPGADLVRQAAKGMWISSADEASVITFWENLHRSKVLEMG
jgi:hypothetical protein